MTGITNRYPVIQLWSFRPRSLRLCERLCSFTIAYPLLRLLNGLLNFFRPARDHVVGGNRAEHDLFHQGIPRRVHGSGGSGGQARLERQRIRFGIQRKTPGSLGLL